MKQIKFFLFIYLIIQSLSLDAMGVVPEEEEIKFPLSHTTSVASSVDSVSDPALMASHEAPVKSSPIRQRRRSQLEDQIAPDALYATVLHLIDNISQCQKEFDQEGMRKAATDFFESRNLVELKKLKDYLDSMKPKQDYVDPKMSDK